MKKLYLGVLFLTMIFCAKDLRAQQVNMPKEYGTVSVFYPAPDDNKQHFPEIYFRLGWNSKAPYKIAVQFLNTGYENQKLKFAIMGTSSKKMVILDTVRNSRFGFETLGASTQGIVWSGAIDNPKDGFSLRLWDTDGDEFDKAPISAKSAEVNQ